MKFFCWILVFFVVVSFGRRPKEKERTFRSSIIDSVVSDISSRLKDPILAQIFENCFPNTLDTTVQEWRNTSGDEDAFIVTGDIHAQWLRDSTNQVLPYIRYAPQDPNLASLICGLIHRQANEILNYPFGNAFNVEDSTEGHQDHVNPPKTPMTFEAKYELDSLAAVLKLSWNYYNWTQDLDCFDWKDYTWQKSISTIINTIRSMQAGTNEEDILPTFTFTRDGFPQASETLPYHGRGLPVKRIGLSKSLFRPSDDAAVFPFLIPANIMTIVELRHISELLGLTTGPTSNPRLARVAIKLANEMDEAIKNYAIVDKIVSNLGNKPVPVYAYEIDGYGSVIFRDDANIPSLLSLPYLGYVDILDSTYLNTRQLVLSLDNPHYFKASFTSNTNTPNTPNTLPEGIGSAHPTVSRGVWPMSIIMRGLTSNDDDEIRNVLEMLKITTAGTYFMHEAFTADNPMAFTRRWFAWANSLFGELILKIERERPHLLFDE